MAQKGTLLEFLDKEQRWNVRCEIDNSVINTKPANLVSPEEMDDGSSSDAFSEMSSGCTECNRSRDGPDVHATKCFMCGDRYCPNCIDDEICFECKCTLEEHRTVDKYGEVEDVQLCFECHDMREVYCEPFIKWEGDGCNRYICNLCFEKKGVDFCDFCGKCDNCTVIELLCCDNCGVMRCYAKDDACRITKCPRRSCGKAVCDDCLFGDMYQNCCHNIEAGWCITVDCEGRPV